MTAKFSELDAQQVDEVLEHLQQDRADQDAEDRAFAAAQATPPEDGGGDAVQLVGVAVGRGRDRVGVEGDQDARDATSKPEDVRARSPAAYRCPSSVRRPRYVRPRRGNVRRPSGAAATYMMPRSTISSMNGHGHGPMLPVASSAGPRSPASPKPLVSSLGDVARQATVKEQAAEGDDERLHPHLARRSP